MYIYTHTAYTRPVVLTVNICVLLWYTLVGDGTPYKSDTKPKTRGTTTTTTYTRTVYSTVQFIYTQGVQPSESSGNRMSCYGSSVLVMFYHFTTFFSVFVFMFMFVGCEWELYVCVLFVCTVRHTAHVVVLGAYTWLYWCWHSKPLIVVALTLSHETPNCNKNSILKWFWFFFSSSFGLM